MLVCGGWLGLRLAENRFCVCRRLAGRWAGVCRRVATMNGEFFFFPLCCFFAPHRHKPPLVSPRVDPGPLRRPPPPPPGNCFFMPCVYSQNTRNF